VSVAALQYEYSVLARGVEEAILPLALARGLGVIVWAPLERGFLTDASRSSCCTRSRLKRALSPSGSSATTRGARQPHALFSRNEVMSIPTLWLVAQRPPSILRT